MTKKKIEGIVEKAIGMIRRVKLFEKFASTPVTLAACFGAEYLKIGHSQSVQEKMVIEGLLVENISQKSDQDIAKFLADYCLNQKITPSRVLCLLPSKQFIFKNVDIPSTEKEEISKIIDLQAGRFTPYMREEIIIDFLCLEMLAQHYTSVLLFIVNRKIADRYASIFEMARMDIDRIIVASECMIGPYLRSLKGTPVQGALGGLHVGEEYSELTVIESNQVVFVRSIPVGGESFRKNAEKAKEDFLTELNRSISAYHDQGVGKPVQIILATGLVEYVLSLGEDLKKSGASHAETVEVAAFDYRKLFDVTEPVMRTVNQNGGLSFFELFCALSQPDRARINLIHQETKLKRRMREGSRDLIAFGIFIMAIFLLLSLIMGSKIYFRRLLNGQISKVAASFSEKAKKLEDVSTKNRIVKKLIASRGKELTVLNIINGFIGDDLYLSQVNYDSEGKVVIAGTAASMSRVFSFVTQLMESNHFKTVETKETKSRKEGKQDVADFVIECALPEGF
ncbi:MAG TPA: pilus assembly protein PilM [Candidatus Omnitrophota bacterium]|nr:pilus assembly protein PilM [Candidatus Omnitrophota bacterium]HPS37297.1 pilus assembly protein PilM [Candidatus Omnitrophota bacterium]